jgi:hypothetical protein
MNDHRQLLPDDPPLQNDGRLNLPEELESLADQLRREASQIAEGAAPRVPAPELVSAVPRRPLRCLTRYVATAGLAAALVAVIVAPWIYRPPVNSERMLPRSEQQAAASPIVDDVSPASAPRVDRSVFLAPDAAPSPLDDEALTEALLAAGGATSDQQRIELLERALERYRQALIAQQQQIQQLQDELRRRDNE